ncbi:MAG TPA: hypothetical protein VHI72_13640 [Hyphomicrobiaceae bacterium]|nr:hypothetical protein [Hyphomicrobiaceae bacterium]
MRMLASVSALSLLLTCSGAQAQSTGQAESAASQSPKPAPERQEPAKDISVRTEAWFKDCKQGWDAATHMTKRDYERTCLRMARERMKFMRDWEKPGEGAKAK